MSILLLRLWTGLLLIAERFINWLASSHIQQGCYGHSQLPLQTCATSHTLNDRRMHQYYLMASDSPKAGFGLHSSMSMLGDITVVFFLHLPIFSILEVRCLPVFCSTKSHIPYCHHEKISRGMSKMSAGSTDKQSNKIFSLPRLALNAFRGSFQATHRFRFFRLSLSSCLPLSSCLSLLSLLFLLFFLSPLQEIPNKFLTELESCIELITNWQVLKGDSCNSKEQ